MHRPVRRQLGVTLLWFAAGVGGLHTAFSLYWAAGGFWLLDTVGAGAVELQRTNRPVAVVVLLGAALVKGAGAALPIWVEYRSSLLMRRLIRAASWLGAAVLVLYGSAIAIVSAAVLAGAISPDGEVDRVGLRGHAMLWNPLFALWGAFLLGGLWFTRRTSQGHPTSR